MRLKLSVASICDVALGQRLKRRFIAQTARRVAGIALAIAEHGEIDVRRFQTFHERAQRALIAHIERAFAGDQQHVDGFAGFAIVDIEIDGPVIARGSVQSRLGFPFRASWPAFLRLCPAPRRASD